MNFIPLLMLIVGLLVIAYRQSGARAAVFLVAFCLVVTMFSGGSLWLVLLLFLAGSLLFLVAVSDVRRRYLTAPLFKRMAVAVPEMSQTEREALEAGTVWWDGDLFSGRPDWHKLRGFPAPALSEPEQAFIEGPLDRLCAMLDDWESTHHRYDLSPQVWAFLKQQKFFGMIIPQQYEGLGFSAQAHSAVVAKIATRSISAAVTVMVPNSLGPGELILEYGTEQQKQHYLPRLARGDEIPCFALTGPEAGSDAAAIPDRGVVCQQPDARGEMQLGVRLSWNKRYITLAPVATVLGIAFKLHDPDGLIGEEPEPGISCALIPTDTPGVEIGARHFPLNGVFMNGPTRGRDVFIRMDQLIGGQAYAGKGWRMLMESLAAGRCISLPALSVGGAQLAARASGAYAAIRRQFNTPIGQFEGVAEALARIAGNTYRMNAARLMTVVALDMGERPSVLSAILKYHLTEGLRSCLNDAMDIQGGSGICLGPHNLFGRAYQTIPIAITVEGANILTRSLIIFGQGAMRSHPTLFKELEALREDDSRAFDRAFNQHLSNLCGHAARSFWLGLSRGRLNPHQYGGLSREYTELSHLAAGFALIADVTLALLGGALKRKERISARLGDALSHLYLASASLKRFHDEGEREVDRPFLDWALADSKYQAQRALLAVLRNYPNRWLAGVLRFVAFPSGAYYRAVDDRLEHKLAKQLMQTGDCRDRLTSDVYIGDAEQQTGRLEAALKLSIESRSIEQKIKRVLGKKSMLLSETKSLISESLEQDIINDAEAALLLKAAKARHAVIQVDAFETLYPEPHFRGSPAQHDHSQTKTGGVSDV